METSPDQNASCFPVPRHVKLNPWPRWPNAGDCPPGLFLCVLFLFLKGAAPTRSSCELAAGRANCSLKTHVQVQGLPAAEGTEHPEGMAGAGGSGCLLWGPRSPRPGRGGGRRACPGRLPATTSRSQDPSPKPRPYRPGAQPLAVGQPLHVCLRLPQCHRVLPSPCYGRGN